MPLPQIWKHAQLILYLIFPSPLPRTWKHFHLDILPPKTLFKPPLSRALKQFLFVLPFSRTWTHFQHMFPYLICQAPHMNLNIFLTYHPPIFYLFFPKPPSIIQDIFSTHPKHIFNSSSNSIHFFRISICKWKCVPDLWQRGEISHRDFSNFISYILETFQAHPNIHLFKIWSFVCWLRFWERKNILLGTLSKYQHVCTRLHQINYLGFDKLLLETVSSLLWHRQIALLLTFTWEFTRVTSPAPYTEGEQKEG